MLVPFADLPCYQRRVSLIDGAFDPLHAGHLAYITAAANMGLPLLCHIASDAYVSTKHPPLLPHEQRVRIVDALRAIAFTHQEDHDTADVLANLRPVAYLKGRDWEGRLPARQVDLCARLGIQIVFLDTVEGSSTQVLAAFLARSAQSDLANTHHSL